MGKSLFYYKYFCIARVTTIIRENFVVKIFRLTQSDEKFLRNFFLLVLLYTANIWRIWYERKYLLHENFQHKKFANQIIAKLIT